MKEIEILYSLEEKINLAEEKIKNYISSGGERFSYVGEKHVIDRYFSSKTFSDLNPDSSTRLSASLRVRQKGSDTYVTYKHDKFNEVGVWLYSDEIETKINDGEIFGSILKALHFEELVVIDNTKRIYESENYELVLEEVIDLGGFVEIEYKKSGDMLEDEVVIIKQSMRELLLGMNLIVGQELNAGKPELMLKKINSKI